MALGFGLLDACFTADWEPEGGCTGSPSVGDATLQLKLRKSCVSGRGSRQRAFYNSASPTGYTVLFMFGLLLCAHGSICYINRFRDKGAGKEKLRRGWNLELARSFWDQTVRDFQVAEAVVGGALHREWTELILLWGASVSYLSAQPRATSGLRCFSPPRSPGVLSYRNTHRWNLCWVLETHRWFRFRSYPSVC